MKFYFFDILEQFDLYAFYHVDMLVIFPLVYFFFIFLGYLLLYDLRIGNAFFFTCIIYLSFYFNTILLFYSISIFFVLSYFYDRLSHIISGFVLKNAIKSILLSVIQKCFLYLFCRHYFFLILFSIILIWYVFFYKMFLFIWMLYLFFAYCFFWGIYLIFRNRIKIYQWLIMLFSAINSEDLFFVYYLLGIYYCTVIYFEELDKNQNLNNSLEDLNNSLEDLNNSLDKDEDKSLNKDLKDPHGINWYKVSSIVCEGLVYAGLFILIYYSATAE